MKSAQIKTYGDSEVVEINPNAPSLNDPSDAMFLVTVKAAGVNPSDWKLREGFFKQMAPLQFPTTLGMDFSGVIEKLGGERVSPPLLILNWAMKYIDRREYWQEVQERSQK